MKQLYEYLNRSNVKTKNVLNKSNRFWIEGVDDIKITMKEGLVFISNDAVTWDKSSEFIIRKKERKYVYVSCNIMNKLSSFFKITEGRFNIGGNILGLTRKEYAPYEFAEAGEFYGVFRETEVVDASELILPNNYAVEDSYSLLFYECKKLLKAPELPAMNVEDRCYLSMFEGCISLTQAPKLPATNISKDCYENMFEGCISLTQAPKLPAKKLENNCYSHMFQGCISLTQAPDLPATKLSQGCYTGMFRGCSALTQAPDLPAKDLANFCYTGMFEKCIALKQAPDLPAKDLANFCYSNMFSDCTTLTQAPDLPATKLERWSYSGMFKNCKSLTTAPNIAVNLDIMSFNDIFRNTKLER